MPNFEHLKNGNDADLLSRNLFRILVAAQAAILLMFVGLSIFARPSADDFCMAAKVRQLGFFDALSYWYFHWSGRYTSNFSLSAFGAMGDIVKFYPLAAISVFMATWLSFCYLAFCLAKIIPFSLALVVGTIATVIFISACPDPAQTFYWASGSFTYQLGNVLVILLVALILRREFIVKQQVLRGFILFFSALLTIAAIGANETSLVLTLMIIVCGTCLAISNRRQTIPYWFSLLLVAIIAASASVLAPGNFERFSTLGSDSMLRPSWWLAFFLYLPWVALRILYWLSHPGLWASAFIVLFATTDTAQKILFSDGQFRRQFLYVPVIWLGGIFALNAIGFIINRYPLPERAESVVLLLYMLGWYPSFIIVAHYFWREKLQKPNGFLRLAATAFLIISLLGYPNVFEGYKDVYRGYRYSKEMNERFAAIDAAKKRGETEITLDTISRPPRTLFAADLTSDPKNHRNACMSEYFELKAIRLGTSPAAPR